MEAKEILKAVIEQRPKDGWIIYPYYIGRAVVNLVVGLILFLVLLGLTAVLIWEFFSTGSFTSVAPDYKIAAIILGIFSFFLLWHLIRHVIRMAHAKSSFLIMADESLVVSLNGKIEEYPYDKIANIRFTYVPGQYSLYLWYQEYIDFTDARGNQQVRIGEHNSFPAMREVFSILKSKI